MSFTARPSNAYASVSFKLPDSSSLEVPVGDAAQLGLQLAVFGPDDEMQRSRSLAEKIATALSLAARGATATLYLTELQRTDLAAGLRAMRDDRADNLAEPLLELLATCERSSNQPDNRTE